jgi:hypothetical protein
MGKLQPPGCGKLLVEVGHHLPFTRFLVLKETDGGSVGKRLVPADFWMCIELPGYGL